VGPTRLFDPYKHLSPIAFGTVIWVASSSLLRPGWIEILLLFAPLVVVPLGLFVAGTQPAGRMGWFRLLAASLLVPALVLQQSLAAALLALPWLLVVLPAVTGVVLRRTRRGSSIDAGLLFDAAAIFLAIGAAGLVVQRAGLQPMGLPHVINLLFAVHYHFAGFGLVTLAGALSAGTAAGRTETIAGLGAVSAVLLMAFAIGFLDWLAPAAAVWMAATGSAIAVLQLRRTSRFPSGMGQVLLVTSSLAGVAAMPLGAAYGVREFLPLDWLTIPWMAAVHGTLNSFGFILCGLVGWIIQRPLARPEE
jgi:hypothetical protein